MASKEKMAIFGNITGGTPNPADPNQNTFYHGTLNFKQLDYDPLVTGYSLIIWDTLPPWLGAAFSELGDRYTEDSFKRLTQKNFIGFSGIEDFQIETQDYNYGYNNNAYQTAIGITKNNTEFTITHKEFSGSPIRNYYAAWVNNIFDPEIGISPYGKKYNYSFAMKNHSGSLMYIVLRPDADNFSNRNIEFAAYFTNVFPKKVPNSHFEFQQGNRDHVQIEIPFSGVMHLSSKVDEYAYRMLEERYTPEFHLMEDFDPDSTHTES